MIVGVVGAGVMGAGVGEALACADHDVVLLDRDGAACDRALNAIRTGVRARALLTPPDRRPDIAAVLARVTPTTDWADLATVEFVIENVTESFAVKEEVYPRIDASVRSDVVIAADTSAIPVSWLAGLTTRPDRVLGLHFMNPVPYKDTVEVVRGPQTSEGALAAAHDLLSSMGKHGIVVGDAPGFVSNRVLMLTVNEAVSAVEDGTASATDVDRIFCECFGHPMGPLATADLIGLDTIVNTLVVLRDSYADAKYEPRPLLTALVADGRLGRKTGEGFFTYGSGRVRG